MDLSRCDGCDGCWLRCAEGVPMSRREYEAVTEYLGSNVAPALAVATATLDREVELGDGVVVRQCRFHDRAAGRCIVYPARPLVCRLMGLVEWMPCPAGRVERLVDTQTALDLLRVYAEDERRTFEEWERLH